MKSTDFDSDIHSLSAGKSKLLRMVDAETAWTKTKITRASIDCKDGIVEQQNKQRNVNCNNE